MMVKQLTVVLALSVLMTACGGSSNKKSSSSASSVAVSSVKSSVVASSVAPSSVASSVAPSSVASSVAPSSVASSVAPSSVASSVAPSSVASSVAPSSVASSVAPSSVASSSKSSSSVASSVASSSSSSGGVACDGNPDSVIDLCDISKWEALNGGGSVAQGASGPIYTVGAPSNYDSGMAYVLTDATLNKVIRTKTLTITFIPDQAFADSKASLQFIVQQKGGGYGGDWDCGGWVDKGNITPGQEMTGVCSNVDAGPADGAESIWLGFQVKPASPAVYAGTITIVDATWQK